MGLRGGGRWAIVLLGIDVGGSAVKAAALDRRPSLDPGEAATGPRFSPRTARVPYSGEVDAAVVARAIAQACDELLHGRFAEVRSIGLCLPGIVDEGTGRIRVATNLPGLVDARVDDLLPKVLKASGGAIRRCTDAYAAAVGHRLIEPAREGRLAAISIGTGVGLSVVDGFEPLRVSGESSGHLGHVDVGPCVPGGAVSGDGAKDTLEAYAGVPALRARFGGDLSSRLAAMGPEDPACIAIVRALRIVHAMYRPHRVALLGGVGRRLSHLGMILRERIADGLTPLAREGWTLEFGSSDALAAIGAARLSGLEGLGGSVGLEIRDNTY